MVEPTNPVTFQNTLPNNEVLAFASAEEFLKWIPEEFNKWQWINASNTQASGVLVQNLQNVRNEFQQLGEQWRQQQSRPGFVPTQFFSNLQAQMQQCYAVQRFIHSTSAGAKFLLTLKVKMGDVAASAAYLTLYAGPIQGNDPVRPRFVEGVLSAFLYKNEIEWTATVHHEILASLENNYSNSLKEPTQRFKDLENRANEDNNAVVNSLKAHDASLSELHKMQTESFQKLHGEQVAELKAITEEHIKNLKNIETVYNQKLALQKPVEYWKIKEQYHSKLAIRFSIASIIVGTTLLGSMFALVRWVFAHLKAGDDPKHWQVGILAVAAFFGVWIVRVLLRMLFSHIHRATDAAERRLMILTFISMSREGAQFAPDDKSLIIQHLFRAASDGLVKDDSAPPGLLEILTRSGK